jgi:hypothetical protein
MKIKTKSLSFEIEEGCMVAYHDDVEFETSLKGIIVNANITLYQYFAITAATNLQPQESEVGEKEIEVTGISVLDTDSGEFLDFDEKELIEKIKQAIIFE